MVHLISYSAHNNFLSVAFESKIGPLHTILQQSQSLLWMKLFLLYQMIEYTRWSRAVAVVLYWELRLCSVDWRVGGRGEQFEVLSDFHHLVCNNEEKIKFYGIRNCCKLWNSVFSMMSEEIEFSLSGTVNFYICPLKTHLITISIVKCIWLFFSALPVQERYNHKIETSDFYFIN